jgi:hypothetical protein
VPSWGNQFLVGLGVHQGRSLTDKTDGSEYGSLENRFFSRFGGFQRLVNPPALHPDHYINLTNELIEKHRTAEGIYTSASDAFKEAKAALGMAVSHAYPPPPVLVEELKNLAQVVEANLATVTALLKDMESPNAPKSIASKVVNYDFAINKHYPVVSVKDKGTLPTFLFLFLSAVVADPAELGWCRRRCCRQRGRKEEGQQAKEEEGRRQQGGRRSGWKRWKRGQVALRLSVMSSNCLVCDHWPVPPSVTSLVWRSPAIKQNRKEEKMSSPNFPIC